MNDVANGKSGSSVAANQRLFFVGSERTVDSSSVEKVSEPGRRLGRQV